MRQVPTIGLYVGTRTPVRIVSGGDLRTAIKTDPSGMEERAGTILTHVRDAERLRVLRPVTAVRKTRPEIARIRREERGTAVGTISRRENHLLQRRVAVLVMNLLYGNFDFEHQLVRSKPQTLPASVLALNAELSYALIAIAQPGDLIWAEEPGDSTFRQHLSALGLPEVRFVTQASQVPNDVNFVPWGWSPAMQQLAEKNGWHCECPDLAAVAKANAREFSARLEREWNVGLLEARTVRNVAELQTAVDASIRQTPSWVVKANFGMSARERILEHGPEIKPAARQWLQKQLRSARSTSSRGLNGSRKLPFSSPYQRPAPRFSKASRRS